MGADEEDDLTPLIIFKVFWYSYGIPGLRIKATADKNYAVAF